MRSSISRSPNNLLMSKKQDQAYLATLSDEQAQRVLYQLLQANPKPVPEAAAITREILSGIDEGEISKRVCNTFSYLDVHVLWEESGKSHGMGTLIPMSILTR